MTRYKFALSIFASTLCCLLPFAPATSIFAQTITATASGTVTDPNGAVVPGATVTVTSNETAQSKTVTTDNEGRYTVPFLQPGLYSITVQSTGFTKSVRSDVKLEVAQTAALDFTLTVGASSETVQISDATTPLLQTETSQLETTIENKLLEDLPTGNRNIFNFIPFVPGTVDVGAALGNAGGAVGSAGNRNFFDSNFSVNGGRASSNDVLLDGVTNTIGDFNGVAISPPQDSIREFKVQSGVAPADYGRTAGGIVNIATKSGTNKFHGSLYEYFQNKALNANGFFRNRNPLTATRVDTKRNQFGGAVGGPIILPRFGEGGKATVNGKDRSFFFFNYEARRETNPFALDQVTVPTAAQRTGNLADLLGGNRTDVLFAAGNPGGAAGTPVRFGQIFNPYGALVPYLQVNPTTGATTVVPGRPIFPNNNLSVLPVCAPGLRTQACLDPVALNVLGFIPLPNSAGTTISTAPGVFNNFLINDTSRFTRDIVAGRIDHNISDKQNLFGRFSYEQRVDAQPNYFNSAASNARTIRDKFANFTINDVYTITPTIVNNLRYGYTRVRANQVPNGQGFDVTTLGLPSYFLNNLANAQFPDFTIGGGNNAQTLPGSLNSGTIGGAGNNQPRDTHSASDSVTLIRGAHTIRTGGEYRLYRFYPFQFFTPDGSFSFNSQFTRGPVGTVSYTNAATAGSPLASFLLGLPSSGNREIITPLSLYHHYGAGFVQDDYKVRRNLTLNLGLRWDIETGTAESHDLVTNFDFNAASPLNGKVGAPSDPFVNQLNTNFTNLRGLLSFPEGGQTRANRNRFAPRVGFAYSYNNKTTIRGGYGLFYLPFSIENPSAQGTNFPTNLTQSAQTSQVTSTTVFLANPFPNGLPAPTGNAVGSLTQLGNVVVAVEPQRKTSYNQQYNLVVSRELARNLVLDVAYVGSHGVRLPIQQLFVDQLSSGTLDFARANYTQPNSCSTQTIAPFTLNIACSALPSVTSPAGGITAFFNQQVANPFVGQIPGTALNSATIARAQLLRPYPQYQGVTLFRPLLGESKYNALQINLQKRFSDGLSAIVNYTRSKLMDTGGVGNGAAFLDPSGAQDAFNYRAREYSLSTLDIPNRFTSLVTYELPFGRNRRFGKNLNRLADVFLGGYQVSGSVIVQSGTPLVITTANGFETAGLAGVGNAARRPDRAGQNTFTDFRNRVRNNLPVIDAAAFQQPAPFTFGNGPRTYGDIRRDPYRNVDLSLAKNFAFNEGRQKIQVRGEFLNAFNYVVFGTPVTSFGSANFGVVNGQGNNPRIVQLVARYTF